MQSVIALMWFLAWLYAVAANAAGGFAIKRVGRLLISSGRPMLQS